VPALSLSHDGTPRLLRTGSAFRKPTLNSTSPSKAATLPNSKMTCEGHAHPAACRELLLYLQASELHTNARIAIDGKRLAATGAFQGGVHGDILQANQDNAIPPPMVSTTYAAGRADRRTAPDRNRDYPDTSNSPVQVRFNWYAPEQRKADHDAALPPPKAPRLP